MRRNVAWAMALLVVAALALPAAAAPAAGTGAIYGVITDSTTGDPFALTDAEMIGVDVFNIATMARTRLWLSDSTTGEYGFASLAAGDYKIRFRYWDASNNLTGYRWYTDKANFDVATVVTVTAGASATANMTLKPLRGAAVSGTLTEKGTGTPLTGELCYSIGLFEASGISLGWITSPDGSGNWTFPMAPAGRLTALAAYSTYDASCGTSPAHLDTWYRGASGWPLDRTNLVADPATFATARIFAVVVGAPVTGIDIAMLPAPTCRGKVPTIFGTTLADTITGTAARDIISGLSGNDTINGLGGNDLLCGDAGNDTLTGGNGLKDIAVGGTGTDACNAETMIGCEITP
jgi:hypothetical protein